MGAEEGDTAVVITINTLGGRVDSALKIRDMLMASDVPTTKVPKTMPMCFPDNCFLFIKNDPFQDLVKLLNS